MAQELKKVQPGDLITADFINFIIDELLDLEAKVSGMGETGATTVPSLFGVTLDSATSLLGQPQVKLKIGNVLDAYGKALDPDLLDTKQRIVINQYPIPGARVNTGVTVDVLVGAKPGSTTDPGGPPPAVLDITGFNPSPARIGEEVTITGKDFFMADLTKNKVTIGGKPTNTPKSTKQTELTVIVPEIDSPPSGENTKTVSVKVESPNGSDTMDLAVKAKRTDAMTVTKFNGIAISSDGTPASQIVIGEKSTATIDGTNFSQNKSDNTAKFDTIDTTAEDGATTALLKFIVPKISSLNSDNRLVDTKVVVSVKGKNSITIPVSIFFVK